LTVSSSTEDGEVLGLDQNLNAARDARGPPDEAGAFEGEHHLMNAGWRDLEVPLHVGFRGRLAEDTAGLLQRRDSANALESLGERESGADKLEEAVAAYRAALQEWTRERVPVDWAASLGNQGIAMMLIADRTNDGALSATAFQQIETAFETERSGGQQQWAAYYQEQLPKAQAIRDRLKGK
jgi:hypothetical protein